MPKVKQEVLANATNCVSGQPLEKGAEPIVLLVEFDIFRFRATEIVVPTLFLEPGKITAFVEEILVGTIQVLEWLLQGL